MINIILAIMKYLMILLFAIFTWISFRAQRDVPEEKKRGTYAAQRTMVLLVHVLAFASIGVNVYAGNVTSISLSQVIVFYVVQLIYIIAMMAIIPGIIRLSKGLNNVMCMFLVIGFVILTRLSYDKGVKQFIYALISTAFFIILLIFGKRTQIVRRLKWVYCIVGLALLLFVLVFATVTKGAKLALDLGFITFQPSEFVKILFVLYVATAFNEANSFRTVLITAIFAAAHILILVASSDLGSALIFFVVYILMVYVATKKIAYILIGTAGFAIACVAGYFLFSHVQTRVFAWLDPWSDIANKGYQITQSLFAIGTGGWLGLGLYGGAPGYVPEVSNDFVFAAISEELGGIFSIFLILLCLCFTLMIFRIAIRINKTFYKMLAFGLGAVYGFQVFLTIGGAIKLLPSTGINLPFISSGGSSLVASMLMVALVQSLYVISEADVEREREAAAESLMFEKQMQNEIDMYGDTSRGQYYDGQDDEIVLDDELILDDYQKEKGGYDRSRDPERSRIIETPQENIESSVSRPVHGNLKGNDKRIRQVSESTIERKNKSIRK